MFGGRSHQHQRRIGLRRKVEGTDRAPNMASLLASILFDGRDDRPNNLDDTDYGKLRRLLDQFVADGCVRKIPAFNPLYPGCREEWFLDVEAGDVYCLVLADE